VQSICYSYQILMKREAQNAQNAQPYQGTLRVYSTLEVRDRQGEDRS